MVSETSQYLNKDKYTQELQCAIEETKSWAESLLSETPKAREGFQKEFKNWIRAITPDKAHLEDGTFVIFLPQYKYDSTKKSYDLEKQRSITFVVTPDKELSIHEIKHGKKHKNAGRLLNMMKRNGGRYTRQILENKQKRGTSNLKTRGYHRFFVKQKAPPINFMIEKLLDEEFLPQENIPELNRKLSRIQKLTMRCAASDFISSLNQDSLRTILATRNRDMRSYNWLSKGQTEFRIGAMQSYPAFAKDFLTGEFTKAIDSGQSITQSLTEIFGGGKKATVHKQTFKPFHGKKYFDIGHDCVRASRENADVLSLIPVSDYPKDPKEWKGFNKRCDILKYLTHVTSHSLETIVKNIGTDPDFFEKNNITSETLRDITDFKKEIETRIILPQVIQTDKKHGLKTFDKNTHKIHSQEFYEISYPVITHMTPKQLIKANQLWHERVTAYQTNINSLGVSDDLKWEPLTDKLTAPNGVIITALTSKSQLSAEGDKMNHCVGGYSSSCITGTSHIINLEDTNGICSTLQLKEKEIEATKQITVYSSQHKAKHNHTPNQDLKDAAKWYMEQINDGLITVDWESIHETRSKNAKEYNKNAMINVVGFDPYDKDKCIEAFDLIKRYIPGSLGKMSLDQFIETTNMQEGIDKALGIIPSQKKSYNIDNNALRRLI